MDAHGACLLAVSAKGATEYGITEISQFFFGRDCFLSKQPSGQPHSAFQDFFQSLHTIDGGKFSLPGCRHGRTYIRANPAVGAGPHFKELSNAVFFIILPHIL
jgi:hypothetical protein